VEQKDSERVYEELVDRKCQEEEEGMVVV